MKTSKVNFISAVLCFFALMVCSSTIDNEQKQNPWAEETMWYKAAQPYNENKIDVLYFVSTDVVSARDSIGQVVWQSQLIPADVAAMNAELDWVSGIMFCNDFNFYAPYYHQFTFDAIWQLDKVRFDSVYCNVAREACDAFDFYMAHKNNGRPFVLAGFSQGAMLTLEVLKHMTDSQFSQMIACYTIGYRLTAKDLEHPHIKAATGETDRGVVISFNSTQTREAIWPFVSEGAATCINPVNWRTDATPAEFAFRGTNNTVHVDPETNVLIVNTDNPSFYYAYYDKATFFADAHVSRDCMHHWDLLFYCPMIHDNALKRAGK